MKKYLALAVLFLSSALGIAVASDLQQQQSTLYPYQSTLEIQEDFAAGGAGSTSIGILGWSISGGTGAFLAPVAGRPGLYRRDTGAAIVEASTFLTGAARSFLGTETFTWTWAFRLNTNDANTTFKAGVATAAVGLPFASGLYIEKLDGDTNWYCVSRQTTETRVDSGIPVSTNFINVAVVKNSSGAQFYIDKVAVCGLITGTPVTSAQLPVAILVSSAAASKTVDLDYFQLRITSLSR